MGSLADLREPTCWRSASMQNRLPGSSRNYLQPGRRALSVWSRGTASVAVPLSGIAVEDDYCGADAEPRARFGRGCGDGGAAGLEALAAFIRTKIESARQWPRTRPFGQSESYPHAPTLAARTWRTPSSWPRAG